MALSHREDAIEIADKGSGLTLLPEFYSLKGNLMAALPEANGSGAEDWFLRAFNVAQELDQAESFGRSSGSGARSCSDEQDQRPEDRRGP